VTLFVARISPVVPDAAVPTPSEVSCTAVFGATYADEAVNAALPRVPPAPTFSVEPSVPARVRVLLTVRVFEVVPPAAENPVVRAVSDNPL